MIRSTCKHLWSVFSTDGAHSQISRKVCRILSQELHLEILFLKTKQVIHSILYDRTFSLKRILKKLSLAEFLANLWLDCGFSADFWISNFHHTQLEISKCAFFPQLCRRKTRGNLWLVDLLLSFSRSWKISRSFLFQIAPSGLESFNRWFWWLEVFEFLHFCCNFLRLVSQSIFKTQNTDVLSADLWKRARELNLQLCNCLLRVNLTLAL